MASTGSAGSADGVTEDGSTAPVLERWQVGIAFTVAAFGLGMGNQLGLLVPLRARELGAGLEAIGIIVAASSLAAVFLSVPLGAAIDRLGPKRSFVLGAGLSSFAAILFMTVTNYWLLVPLQLLAGVCTMLGWIASQTYVTGMGRAEDRISNAGRFGLFSNIGVMAGPLLAGGTAQVVGLRFAFVLPALYAAAFAALGSLLADTRPATPSGRGGVGLKTAAGLLSLPGIRFCLVLTFVRLWISWVWIAFFPVLLVDGGMATGVAGTVVATRGLVATLLAPTVGVWCRYVSQQALLVLGLGCGAVGLVLAPHLAVMPVVYVSPVLVGVGVGLSLPLLLSLIGEAAPEGQRGVALGLRTTMSSVGQTAAPVIAGPLLTGLGIALGFGVSGGIAVLFLVAAGVLHMRQEHMS